ncbi:hypothetical protein [Burkholderia multivorans]|uniref:hypothetical protein n=1 Tax=Burkholderia multivorans TaxID=87883 RepID=UPI0011B23B20|nr:hypothetical protein [Burkholderia multivorans]
MTDLFGLPQSLTGNEFVTIHQEQNGNLVKCTMPLSMLTSFLATSTAWASKLPVTQPTISGAVWNNNGVVSIS